MAKGKRGATKGGGKKKKGSSVVGCLFLIIFGLFVVGLLSPRSSQKNTPTAAPNASQRRATLVPTQRPSSDTRRVTPTTRSDTVRSTPTTSSEQSTSAPIEVAQAQAIVQPTEPMVIADGETAVVVSIIDGDTIDVSISGQTARIRYIGVNTPERNEACSNEATAANASLVAGNTVTLVKDVSETDRFDRLLRYVYVGDTFVNAELVRQGFAEAVEYPPDTAHAQEFALLEAQASSAALGCHPTGVFGGSTVVEASPIPATPVPVAGGLTTQNPETYYVTSGTVNARSCERTDCTVISRLTAGTAVTVTGWIQGDSVNGNDIWRQITLNGETAYVHSGLLSVNAPPVSAPVQVQQPQQPAEVPPQQVMSTPPPLVEQPVQPAWNCSGDLYNCADLTCSQMASYWAACPGDPSNLDGNGDGAYCESKC